VVVVVSLAATIVMVIVGTLAIAAPWLLLSHRVNWSRHKGALPPWWDREIDGPGLRNSVRLIDEQPPAVMTEARDVRRVK